MAACTPPGDVTPENLFIPPAVAASPAPEETPTPADHPPTSQPACTSSLRFIEDITIPDGTAVNPGGSLDKRWRVENSGTCNWDTNFSLRLINGDPLGAASPLPLYPAVAGSAAALRIMFTAPLESGVYRSAWQAHDPAGNPFGDPVFIEIVVP
jgi:hypothetical protein